MALYKFPNDVATSDSTEFDTRRSPGTPTPHSGVYQCLGCRREIAANKGDPLPPQNHHQHLATQGPIVWRLSVFAEGDRK